MLQLTYTSSVHTCNFQNNAEHLFFLWSSLIINAVLLYYYGCGEMQWIAVPAASPVSAWDPAVQPAQPSLAEPGTGPTEISSGGLRAGSWSRWSGVCAPSWASHWPFEPPCLVLLSLQKKPVKPCNIPVMFRDWGFVEPQSTLCTSRIWS